MGIDFREQKNRQQMLAIFFWFKDLISYPVPR